jgi:hypothetical protein
MPRLLATVIALSLAASAATAADPPPWEQAVRDAAKRPPMTATEAKAFARQLADYVAAHHLKTDAKSAQKGMVYEYFDTTRAGWFDQWVQGEALDTMHDGAWLAAAMASAARATGDPFYTEFLTKWQLPFYANVLNHSDELFNTKQVNVADNGVRFNKEHKLIDGEKGFCPYWWDDGASVSLERRRKPGSLPPFACTDRLAGQTNPQARLSGYSHGCSNHMAQDLAVMLQQGWLLLRDDPAHAKLAGEVARAAKHLHESRLRHFGTIPAVVAAAGLTNGDAALLAKVPGVNPAAPPANHYTRFLGAVGTTRRESTPGFADDAEYLYYQSLARFGAKLPRAVRFKLVYDAYTDPMLFRYWSDDAAVPPGLNRFDLIGHGGRGGKFDSYRSDRPVPFGSRFGPQNMVVCGWAAQALKADPKLWDDTVRQLFPKELLVRFLDGAAKPAIDGRPEAAACEAFTLSGVTLRLVSTRNALIVQGTFPGDTATIELQPTAKAKGPRASVTVTRGGSVTATNGTEPLRITGKVRPGTPTAFEFALPYTVSKDQKAWGNGIELGRYTVKVGDAAKTFVLANTGEQVRRAVERELSGGLRTWQAVFAAKGYIPTALNAGPSWDRFSDSGGYAHLISAAAQYLLLLDGKTDWDVQQVPARK